MCRKKAESQVGRRVGKQVKTPLPQTHISVYICLMLTNDKANEVITFWEEYEAKIGEKVLAKSLSRYMSGWGDFTAPLWGLAIATSGGFRFHHFPKNKSFFGVPLSSQDGKQPAEKTFFIPTESIISTELIREERWWKKIFSSPVPTLIINYNIHDAEKKMFIEIDRNADDILEALRPA